MDSLVARYVGKLHESSENDGDASSNLVVLNEVLNTEREKKGNFWTWRFSFFFSPRFHSCLYVIEITILVLDLNLEILFKEETGIIPYLKLLSRRNNVDKDLLKELSNLLKCIIADFTKAAAKYIPSLVVGIRY